jgi:hypothetical protein
MWLRTCKLGECDRPTVPGWRTLGDLELEQVGLRLGLGHCAGRQSHLDIAGLFEALHAQLGFVLFGGRGHIGRGHGEAGLGFAAVQRNQHSALLEGSPQTHIHRGNATGDRTGQHRLAIGHHQHPTPPSPLRAAVSAACACAAMGAATRPATRAVQSVHWLNSFIMSVAPLLCATHDA